MKNITIQIPDDEYLFLIELLSKLSIHIRIEEEVSPSKEELLANIRQSFIELKEAKEGKISGQPISDVVNDL